MLSNNNTPLPSVTSKHGPSAQYYISSRLESGEKAPDVTFTNFWYKGVWRGGGVKFSNGVFWKWRGDRGICGVCLSELTFNAVLSQAISILNSLFHLIL